MEDQSELNRYSLASASTRRINHSTKLWRYLTFEKFAWLLEKSKLYHARLDFLGDPFEGSLTAAYVRKRDSGQEVRRISDGISTEWERFSLKATMYSRFASCWYASEHESAAMWKLYSAEHAGVAVVSSVLRLYDSVRLAPFQHGILSPVEYLDFEKDDMTLPNSMGRFAMPGLLKRKSFQHENEVRGLIDYVNHSNMPAEFSSHQFPELVRKNNPTGISVDVNLHQLISDIHLSPLASPHFKEVVEIMAERHGLTDRIRPSTLLGEPVW